MCWGLAMQRNCECGAQIEAETIDSFENVFLQHVRGAHPDWRYPDVAVRNVGAAMARLTGSAERLPQIGDVEVHQVTSERIADWLDFFDCDVFAGRPVYASCYCLENHLRDNRAITPWRERRAAMVALFDAGVAFGYLAYVGGKPAGWVNAAMRNHQSIHRSADADPPDHLVVSVACCNIAPPYRRYGLATTLLDRVITDAPGRDARWIEAYPLNAPGNAEVGSFRGPRSLYEARGFDVVRVRQRDTVVRRAAAVAARSP